MIKKLNLFMSTDLKPHSLECGSNFKVLNLGSSRKPLNKPHTKVCGKLKVFLIIVLILTALLPAFVSAAASFQVTAFSCSPSETAINEAFSCAASVRNTGDASGSVSTATLYPDGSWLEDASYPQASGTSVSAGQSTEITFSGLRAVSSGYNGFSKIMLDSVTDVFVADEKINIIDVAVSVSNSQSSAVMSASWDSTAAVTAGGNIDVTLTLSVSSGGCGIGSQPASKSITGMQNGNAQSRSWTITQGTTAGNCVFTITAAATGAGGLASKTDSSSSTITCPNCPVSSSSSSGGAGGGAGGGGGSGGTKTYYIADFSSPQTVELAKGERISFNISNIEYLLSLDSFTETTAVIRINSKPYNLNLGEVKMIDINGGEDDISVNLKSVNIITNKTTLVLAPLFKQGEAGAGIQEEGKGKEKAGGGILGLKSNKTLWIIIGVLSVIAAAALLYYFTKKKKRRWGYE